MSLDYKGLTEEEIQKIIDWKVECKEFDKLMWKIHFEDMIRNIIYNSIKEEPIRKPSKPLKRK